MVWARASGPVPALVPLKYFSILEPATVADCGRLGSSVRSWPAEAATAADLKWGAWWGAKPPKEKK